MIAEKPTENMENIIDNLKYCEGDYCNYMKFVVYLLMIEKGKLDENLNSQLKKWLDKNVKEDVQSKLLKEIEEIENRPPNPYLLLVINSKATNEYALTAWYVADYNYQSNSSDLDFEQIILCKNKNNNEFIINAKSSDFINQIEDCMKKIDDEYNIDTISQIHFFVPTCLMSYNIDCCKIDNDYIIGEKKELIIRCSERINKPNSSSIRNGITKWQRKANIFKEEKLRISAVEIFTSSDDNGDGYINFNKRLENDDKLIGVYFTNILQNNDDYYNLLLKGGIPLALWIRQELDNINIKEALSNILKNEILLKDLPKQVMRERGKGQPISQHLCLLWDDPNLLPPEQMLNQSKL